MGQWLSEFNSAISPARDLLVIAAGVFGPILAAVIGGLFSRKSRAVADAIVLKDAHISLLTAILEEYKEEDKRNGAEDARQERAEAVQKIIDSIGAKKAVTPIYDNGRLVGMVNEKGTRITPPSFPR